MACIYFLDAFVIPSGSEGTFLAFMRSLYVSWAVSQLAVLYQNPIFLDFIYHT
jgi:hypothetical protein